MPPQMAALRMRSSSGLVIVFSPRDQVARIFRTVIQPDANADSDIDLRIDKGSIRGLQMGGLAADLEDAFGLPVDLVPTGSLDRKFLHSISDDEVLLYEAS